MYEDSWFQLEGAAWRPFRHPLDAVRHGFNFMQYKLRQSQVSLGESRVVCIFLRLRVSRTGWVNDYSRLV